MSSLLEKEQSLKIERVVKFLPFPRIKKGMLPRIFNFELFPRLTVREREEVSEVSKPEEVSLEELTEELR